MSNNNLIFLSKDDFHLAQGKTGELLYLDVPNLCFTLFFHEQCSHCSDFLGVFSKLQPKIPFCRFALINFATDDNRDVYEMSKQTICPIKYVPFLVLYIHNKPTMVYEGERNAQEITKFLTEVYKRYQSLTNSGNGGSGGIVAKSTENIYKNGIIPYNILICDKDSCFIGPSNKSNSGISANNICFMSMSELSKKSGVKF